MFKFFKNRIEKTAKFEEGLAKMVATALTSNDVKFVEGVALYYHRHKGDDVTYHSIKDRVFLLSGKSITTQSK